MTNIARELPQLPVELLESYSTNEELIPLYHSARASTCIKQINRLSIMLKTETMLLHKIRYKQKNQHKSATWWRHVSGSQRVSYRLLEQLEKGVVPNLPNTDDKQPVISAQAIFSLCENSLRILLFLDQTLTFHTKAAAAAQQLLRAALFMPLAMTLKALIARLCSIWTCLKDELQAFLSLLRASPKKKSKLAQDLESRITTLPRELRTYWKAISPKGSKNLKGASTMLSASASASASATSSAIPSRTQSPAVTSNALPGKSSLSQSHKPVEEQAMALATPPTSHSTLVKPKDSSIALEDMMESESTPQLASEAVPKVKKVKKRKNAAPGDDIDAIFAGL